MVFRYAIGIMSAFACLYNKITIWCVRSEKSAWDCQIRIVKRKILWQNDSVILYDAGDFHKYDGLTGLFVKLVNADNELWKDAYMKRWYRLSMRG